MIEGYKSSEDFCAVSEIWVSNVNNLCIGIAYAGSEISHGEDRIF